MSSDIEQKTDFLGSYFSLLLKHPHLLPSSNLHFSSLLPTITRLLQSSATPSSLPFSYTSVCFLPLFPSLPPILPFLPPFIAHSLTYSCLNFSTSFNRFLPPFLALLIVSSSSSPSFLSPNSSFAFLHLHSTTSLFFSRFAPSTHSFFSLS